MGIIKTQQEFIGNSKRSGIPKGLQRISFCDYLRNFYSVKQIEIEPSSFNGYQNILEFILISMKEISNFWRFLQTKSIHIFHINSTTVSVHQQ